MMDSQTAVRCVLCQGGQALNTGNLHNFKAHLETAHSAVFDLDFLMSIAFLETAERERIVETVYPRVKKYFQTLRTSTQNYQLNIEKRLLEDLEEDGGNDVKRRKMTSSKYASLSEEQEDEDSKRRNDSKAKIEERSRVEVETVPAEVTEETAEDEKIYEARCDICEKPMLKKSIRKHKQRVHGLYDNPRSSIFSINDTVTEDITATEDVNVTEDVTDIETLLEPEQEMEVDDKEVLGKQGTIPCEVCFKQISKRNIKRHLRTVHSKQDREEVLDIDVTEDHKCRICLAKFSVLDTLKDHVKDVHDIDYDNLESCEAQDEDDDVQLDYSTSESTGEVEEESSAEHRYQCDQCDAKYHIKDSLRRHKRKKH